MRVAAAFVLVIACAPAIDGPAERASAADAADAQQIEAALRAGDGVIGAHVVLHRTVRDPLSNATSSARAAVLALVDDHVDRDALTARATQLVQAIVPDVTPHVIVALAGHRAELANVGPFTVSAGSKRPLTAVLVALLAAVAALAGYIAWRDRPT